MHGDLLVRIWGADERLRILSTRERVEQAGKTSQLSFWIDIFGKSDHLASSFLVYCRNFIEITPKENYGTLSTPHIQDGC
jgi:hypothetical protein